MQKPVVTLAKGSADGSVCLSVRAHVGQTIAPIDLTFFTQ